MHSRDNLKTLSPGSMQSEHRRGSLWNFAMEINHSDLSLAGHALELVNITAREQSWSNTDSWVHERHNRHRNAAQMESQER